MPGELSVVMIDEHFSEFSKIFVLFTLFFFVKICPDDDCRTTVETSVYLSLSIMSGDNDLL